MDIIIIGGQKCGTTYLYKLLENHPQVVCSRNKELDFFSYPFNYAKGLKFYKNQFPIVRLRKLRGIKYLEASPSYLFDVDPKRTAERIKKSLPRVKLICLVRNPVDRAYSAYKMYSKWHLEGRRNWWFDWVRKRNPKMDLTKVERRDNAEYENFEKFLDHEIECIESGVAIECSILGLGIYARGIRAFQRFFDQSNLIVLTNESFRKEYELVMSRLNSYLDLRLFDWGKYKDFSFSEGNYDALKDRPSIDKLREFYRPYNTELFHLTGVNYNGFTTDLAQG